MIFRMFLRHNVVFLWAHTFQKKSTPLDLIIEKYSWKRCTEEEKKKTDLAIIAYFD